jgi:hypothetical protein
MKQCKMSVVQQEIGKISNEQDGLQSWFLAFVLFRFSFLLCPL